VLGLAQEPLLQLLEPSLGVMIDKVPQARLRIATAQRRLVEAIDARDAERAHTWMARHIRDFRKGYELAGIALELQLSASESARPQPRGVRLRSRSGAPPGHGWRDLSR
jgi:hypothetical protein